MKFSHSIQRRVFYIFGSFTLLLTILYSGLSILVAYSIEDEVLENILAQEVGYVERSFKETGQVVQARVDYIAFYSSLENAPDEIATEFENGSGSILFDKKEIFGESGKHYHVQAVYLDKTTNAFLVADVTSLLAVRNLSGNILILFALVLFFAMATSVALAYLIARRTTKPVVALTHAVIQQHANTDNTEQATDEIDFLTITINNALDQLKTLLKRESEFNRDLSHELRTPLTVTLNTLSLGKSRTLTQIDISQLNNAAEDMKKTVTTLLALARDESLSKEVFALKPLLEQCIVSLYPKLQESDFKVQLSVGAIQAVGNPQLFSLVVNNLIENAVSYSSQRAMDIRSEGTMLIFENFSNNDIPPDPTDSGTRQADSKGLGQGLFLVKRILETMDWRFEITSNKQAFRFSVEVPPPD